MNKQPKLYKKIRERTFENVGYGPITLDAFEYDTTGLSLLPPPEWKKTLDEKDRRFVGAALYGLRYILHRTSPSICMADKNDIGTDVSLHEADEQDWKSALYLYDAHEGGVGYAEKIFEAFEEALRLCKSVIDDCSCTAGCPSCVPAVPPGVADQELEELMVESNASVACTLSLLNTLLSGTRVLPVVTHHEIPSTARVDAPAEDLEMKMLRERLGHAGRILKRKRSRIH